MITLRPLKWLSLALLLIVITGLLIPERIVIPVAGASSSDWNHQTFWFEPWGSSGVHKGIDIFGDMETAVLAATSGVVVYTGYLSKGGNVIAVLGPKWRIHYVAHLNSTSVQVGDWVERGETVGTLGDTGNAKGKAPHVHYSIVSVVPIPWRMTTDSQGWKKMFFLNPHDKLI
ncbi:M23 family metallopeptidase [Alteromonas sp. ASW11-36]|uniref:M23 family metallopeptidase n=1 Tax=Alteromonas arenosi TaxID=3055817 RepID=A0ABT7T3H9_9ALTE|nr:M23 family metallopeptidase [Alteromonas sp. ASW11-36]MDM7862319.1 M23 family metallopeptidase [Alteromonas sp. ASW11-36]